MPDKQRRFRQPRIRTNSESRDDLGCIAKAIRIALAIALLDTLLIPVGLVAVGVFPSRPEPIAATIESLRIGVVAGAGLGCIFLLAIPDWHWAERLVAGAGSLVALAFAAIVLALDPIRFGGVTISPDLIPLAPLVVWAVATPMVAARVWGGMRMEGFDANREPGGRHATISGMLAYLAITGAAIGAISVRDLATLESVVFIAICSLGIGAILVPATALLLFCPPRNLAMIAGPFFAMTVLVIGGRLLAVHAASGLVCSMAIAAMFYALFVFAFRLERLRRHGD